MIGSRGFLWALGCLGLVASSLITMGAQSWVQRQSVEAPEFVAAKSDMDTLKVAIKVLSDTSDQHTYQIADFAKAQEDAAQVQNKILDAIGKVQKDLSKVDNHLSAVGQQVSDQAEQIKEVRAAQK